MVSIRATVTAITLITLCLLATNTSAARYGCCQSYIKQKIPFKMIRGYSVQTITGMCSIDAIIFHTTRGKVCTNPALKWVMDYVDRVRSKAQKVHMNTSQAQK